MQPTTYVSYYRVSTQKQGESGLGLDAQMQAVQQFVGSNQILAHFTEIESGGKIDRPQLNAALAYAKANNATLVIAKLDRLSRSAHLVSCLLESGVNFVACDNPHATPLLIRVLAAVAQEEREQIGKRVRVALAAARARGVKLGGVQESTVQAINDYNATLIPVIQQINSTGALSLAAIANELNQRGYTTRKGGQFSAMQVKRILDKSGVDA